MTRRKRLTLIGFGVTLLVCAVIVGALAWPREPDLMAHATEIMSLHGARCVSSYWDTDSTCLDTTATATGLPIVTRIDMAHKTVTPLTDLNRKIVQLYPERAWPGAYKNDTIDSYAVSLDDQWIRVGPFVNPKMHRDNQCYGIRVSDGVSFPVALIKNLDDPVFLLPDRHHRTEEDGTILTIHSIDSSRAVHVLPLNLLGTVAAPAATFGGDNVLCSMPDGRIITGSWHREGWSPNIYLWIHSLGVHTATAKPLGVITLSRKDLVKDVAVSSDGKYVAYQLIDCPFVAYSTAVRDVLNVFDYDPPAEEQFWISRVDGSGRHKLYCALFQSVRIYESALGTGRKALHVHQTGYSVFGAGVLTGKCPAPACLPS